MDKPINHRENDCLDLGAASTLTKGVGVGGQDDIGQLPQLGLSDD